MTTTEVAARPAQPTSLREQMDYARAVTSGGGQSILPDAYRGNAANALVAIGLGQAMGLSPAESLYRINVIKGKPSAGAELIAANVRKAGHRLRVVGDDTSCTATIIRADDPDFEFTVTRDMAWAKSMGLDRNDNYRRQPGTMLQWRAITACARLACPEALYGVAYTADELYDMDGGKPSRPTSPPTQARPGPGMLQPPAQQETPTGDGITRAQHAKIGATLRDLGVTDRDLAIQYVSQVIGRDIASRNDLTRSEAGQVIEALEHDLAARDSGAVADVTDVEIIDDGDETGWPPVERPGDA